MGQRPQESASSLDISEKGRSPDGTVLRSDRRLFMQLQVFTDCFDCQEAARAVEKSGIEAALYQDVNDPRGIGLLTFSEDPNHFVTAVRELLVAEPFRSYSPRPADTMFGRTYTIGYEPDLDEVLLHRPRRRALDPELRWVVWYPLRRSGPFAKLPAEEQMEILREHSQIGFSFGSAGLGHDIRLACHGLDRNDNDFLVGLLGSELHPLSAVVQAMRATVQTSTYLDRLGPFFVGRVVYQSPIA